MHPVLFEVSGLTVYSYGVCTVLSYLAFGGLLMFTAKRLEHPRDGAVLVAVGLVFGALLGGRLGFVLFNLREPGIFGCCSPGLARSCTSLRSSAACSDRSWWRGARSARWAPRSI